MYVKIKKCSDDEIYQCYIDCILKVNESSLNYYKCIDKNIFILKSDCEIIDFDENKFDGEKFIDDIFEFFSNESRDALELYLRDFLEERGYIKKNRIDELKGKINSMFTFEYYADDEIKASRLKEYIELQKELIELYEKELKK